MHLPNVVLSSAGLANMLMVAALKDSAGSSLNDIAEYILTSCNVELKNGVDLIRLVKLSARQAVRNSMLIKSKDNLYKIPRTARKTGSPNKPKVCYVMRSRMAQHHVLISVTTPLSL